MGTNVRLPKIHRVSSTVEIGSSRISVSVELWDTDVCFLLSQLRGTNVRHPKLHRLPRGRCLSLPDHQQSLSHGRVPICNVVLYIHMPALPVIARVVNV